MLSLLRFLWFVFVVLIVGMAVSLSIARLVLPEMSAYREQLEVLAQERFNYDIRIGSLGASWERFSPVLILHDVMIPAGKVSDETLHIRKVHIHMNLAGSIRKLDWRTHHIELIGFNLSIYRSTDGRWSLTRIPPEITNTHALDFFMEQKRVGFDDARISWIDEQQGGIKRVFNDVKFLILSKQGRRFFFTGNRIAGRAWQGSSDYWKNAGSQ